jgi:DNA-binding LytR/AlgR family response regulator
MSERPTALVADDERLLREQLQARLAECWPELQLLASARDGLEAVKLADELRPNVVFLDIRMPGLTGIEAAREIAALDDWRGEIVFATAYDEYAVTAFEEGAVDYLLKPVERARLDITVARLRTRLAQSRNRCQRSQRGTRQRHRTPCCKRWHNCSRAWVVKVTRHACAGCNVARATAPGW